MQLYHAVIQIQNILDTRFPLLANNTVDTTLDATTMNLQTPACN